MDLKDGMLVAYCITVSAHFIMCRDLNEDAAQTQEGRDQIVTQSRQPDPQ